MDNMECNLKSPFKEAFENGDSIDYELAPGAKKNDHTIVKEMGYETKMHSDCSYSAKGLPGLSLSSYGDWGTIYVDDANDVVKKLFLDMCAENIIRPWRVRTYVDGNCYDYDNNDKTWITYDEEQEKWVKTDSPYTK